MDDREEGMSKYGVDTTSGLDQEAMEKRAVRGCPICSKQLVKYGSVLICPTHGSEPFERDHER